jgi:hypothetical protein
MALLHNLANLVIQVHMVLVTMVVAVIPVLTVAAVAAVLVLLGNMGLHVMAVLVKICLDLSQPHMAQVVGLLVVVAVLTKRGIQLPLVGKAEAGQGLSIAHHLLLLVHLIQVAAVALEQ